MPNQYNRDYSAILPIGPSIAYIPLTQGFFALVDREDAEMLAQRPWQVYKRAAKKTTYAYRTPRVADEKKWMMMHQVICPCVEGHLPDHVNRNGLDNRKANLRPATYSQSVVNQNQRTTNKSGVRGVWFDKKSGKYRTAIYLNKRKIWLGRFAELEAAVEARQAAERIYYGEYAPSKHHLPSSAFAE